MDSAAMLLHMGHMGGASFPFERIERDRLIREQAERDRAERETLVILTAFEKKEV